MAKKRVYELAKERGLSSKELLARLQEAGVDVKAAASSVDEAEVAKLLSSGSKDGAQAKAAAEKKAATEKKAAAAKQPTPSEPKRAAAPKLAPSEGKPSAPKAPAPAARAEPTAAPRPKRVTEGERPAGPPSRRRRVVIDSQASRRQAPPPPQQQRRRRSRGRGAPPPEPTERTGPTAVVEAPAVKIPSGATVKDVAEHLGLGVSEVIKKLMAQGEMASITQTLSDEAIEVLADELKRRVEVVHAADEEAADQDFEDSEEDLLPRPPVITIMGHVDHGKTSLLDAIRETEVAAKEAGGITQAIGAYQVHHGDKIVTFLDTPGHEAFTAMRARGARATDIAVIVVAADDGVMPQTTEAIDHAKAAEVPMVIAVNKIDKEGSDPARVRNELAAQGLTPEEWGGETVYCDVSAKTKQGLDQLLDMILLVAEVEELKANPSAPGSGIVIESGLDPGRGPVATVVVQRGTLKAGDALVAGAHWGRVRAMQDFMGRPVDQAGPAEPVQTLGFNSVPDAGETVRTVENDRTARQLAEEREHRLKVESLARRQAAAVSLEDVFERVRAGKSAELSLILKADAAGSLEAIQDEIAKLPQDQVSVRVLHTATGGISNSDVMLAAASGAVIIGFNVRPLPEAANLAVHEGVDVRTYTVIYKITEDLRAAMLGMLEPEEVEESLGLAEVRQTFKASRVGTIAGCYVTQGKIARNAKVRLVRDGTIVYEGSIGSLKRFKDDVREVDEGMECGIVLENFQDVKEGDVIEAFQTKQVERKLT
jgi:translation initiation factor IF-2